jgi:hypothetical protein
VPALIDSNFVSAGGVVWPSAPSPQHSTLPTGVMAQVWASPAVT